ncbi:hypothetical protein F5Y01DRAFT_5500 [Xylaria sp. FL0043]|nr:hypothetical protein F5Y01DRAFT_5500 [Xylaria sp. FL0043]
MFLLWFAVTRCTLSPLHVHLAISRLLASLLAIQTNCSYRILWRAYNRCVCLGNDGVVLVPHKSTMCDESRQVLCHEVGDLE